MVVAVITVSLDLAALSLGASRHRVSALLDTGWIGTERHATLVWNQSLSHWHTHIYALTLTSHCCSHWCLHSVPYWSATSWDLAGHKRPVPDQFQCEDPNVSSSHLHSCRHHDWWDILGWSTGIKDFQSLQVQERKIIVVCTMNMFCTVHVRFNVFIVLCVCVCVCVCILIYMIPTRRK